VIYVKKHKIYLVKSFILAPNLVFLHTHHTTRCVVTRGTPLWSAPLVSEALSKKKKIAAKSKTFKNSIFCFEIEDSKKLQTAIWR
jgi:hypothetical protein